MLCRWCRQVCGAQSARKKRKGMRLSKNFSHAPDKFRKSRWQKTRLARNCRGASFAAGCRGGEETGKAELHGGIPPRVEDINRRLPVTGQGKMEFLLRICLCHMPGCTGMRLFLRLIIPERSSSADRKHPIWKSGKGAAACVKRGNHV